MQKTENYGLNRPEASDFYDVEHFNENMDILDTKMKEIEEIANPDAIKEHIDSKENPHEVTKDQVGLGNVPNVTTNNQTPTYTMPSTLTAMESGEKVSVAFGKIAKGIYDFMNVQLTTPSSTATHQVERMQDVRGWLQELMDDIYASNLDKTYPVGSIYMSVNNTNPSTLFGGTWEAWGSGRVPVGVNASDANFNSVEKTGGASTVALTTAQLPKHNHDLSSHTHTIPALTGSATGGGITNGITGGLHTHEVREANDHNIGAYSNSTWSSGSGCFGRTGDAPANRLIATASTHTHTLPNHTHTVTTVASTTSTPSASHTGNQGSGSAHSNLQPYITCYMWKRVA